MTIVHIATQEVRAILSTAVGWLVLAAFALLAGFFWFWTLGEYVRYSQQLVDSGVPGLTLTLADQAIAPWFGNLSVVLLMVSPAVSMRFFSEEYKQRTMELLLTSPVPTSHVVLGKFLGGLAFIALLLSSTAIAPITCFLYGSPDPAVFVGGYAALFLLAAGVLAIGSLFSAMTESQIAALVPTFAVVFVLGILAVFSHDPDSLGARVSLLSHTTELMRGVLRLSDLAYFAGLIGVALLATHQRVESLRWR